MNQKLFDESHIIAIHPSGRVFVYDSGKFVELRLNPRACILATLDDYGVEDFEGLIPISLKGARRVKVDHTILREIKLPL